METQTLTQTITILVGDDGLASTGISLLPLLAIGLALITFGVLAWRFTSRRSHRYKLSFRSFGVFVFLTLAATSLSLNLPSVLAAPTLTLGANEENLTVTVPKGGGTASATTTITTGTTNLSGYELTAGLNESEPGIDISLRGGDVTTSTELTPGAPALSLKTTEEATSDDTTEVTLDFTIDGTVTEGTKDLKLAYTATDNEPPAPTTMQGLSASYCVDHMTIYDGSNEDAILTLTDTRADNQTYQVAKLADNNCWMLNNLKLGSIAGTTPLTPADTDIAADFTLPQVVAVGTADPDNPGAYGPVPGDTGSGSTNYGYLYNWSAATAGESRTSHTEEDGNAPYSICPAGWRLPTGGTYDSGDGEFAALDIAFGGTGMGVWDGEPNIAKWQHDGPFKGTFAGSWWEGFGVQGGWGGLWSSSAHPDDADGALGAYFNADGVYPGGISNRVLGYSVRCLLN